MATRKKKTPKKKKHGGARAGSGRKPISDATMKTGVYVRLDADQRDALDVYIENLNTKRHKAGVQEIKLSTWMRELTLKQSGNEKLGAAGKAATAAKAASVL